MCVFKKLEWICIGIACWGLERKQENPAVWTCSWVVRLESLVCILDCEHCQLPLRSKINPQSYFTHISSSNVPRSIGVVNSWDEFSRSLNRTDGFAMNSGVVVSLADFVVILVGVWLHFAVVQYVSRFWALLLHIIVSCEKGRPCCGATLCSFYLKMAGLRLV